MRVTQHGPFSWELLLSTDAAQKVRGLCPKHLENSWSPVTYSDTVLLFIHRKLSYVLWEAREVGWSIWSHSRISHSLSELRKEQQASNQNPKRQWSRNRAKHRQHLSYVNWKQNLPQIHSWLSEMINYLLYVLIVGKQGRHITWNLKSSLIHYVWHAIKGTIYI